MKSITFGSVRIQLLSEEIVRIEYARKGKFCDDNTFFIPSRDKFGEEPQFKQYGNYIVFGDYSLSVPEGGRGLSGITLTKNGSNVYRYKRLLNSGELPALDKTPEVFALSDNPRIIVPEGGYSKDRKGQYKVEENVQDIYLLLCKKDAKKLRKLYVGLTGRNELVRLSTLGGWNSKYYAYTEDEAKQLISDYEKHNVPLDVMVIDTDWRSCENGWGYDINKKLFPDMKRFLSFAHAHGVEIIFNDHPEPVDGLHVFKSKEIAYRERNLQALMKLGLDMWWYDRNWSTALISPTKNVRWETFGLYLFDEITRHFYQKQSGDKEVYRRPVIMGNVVNVANGCFEKILDSASHRYSVQWTGDILSDADSLSQEVATLIRAGNDGIAYCNADCGGHIGNPDKELFIRWMQFGTLSPVFRPHCTKIVERTREPWAYDSETLDIVREYNNLRYRLLPVIYKNAYNNYETGEPVFKSLGWEYPADRHALRCDNAYMLGNNILIRPVAGITPYAVEKKNFVEPVKAVYYNGTKLEGEPIATAEYGNLNILLNHTSPEKGVPVYNFSARFETVVEFSEPVQLYVRSDDGSTVWIDGEKVLEDKTLHSAMNFPLKVIEGGKPHKVEIEYFQAGGEAAIGLYYSEVKTGEETEVYLPAGKWLDAFSGKIYSGGKTIKRVYGINETPLFVRLGALLPLAYAAANTGKQKWDRLVYDFYPDKNASDKGYLYEDDTATTAYKKGKFRKSAFDAGYDAAKNAYVIKLHASEGVFEGEKYFETREIAVKYHLLKGAEDVKKIAVNGENYGFATTPKDAGAFPLNTDAVSPDGKVILTKFKADLNKEYEVIFYL